MQCTTLSSTIQIFTKFCGNDNRPINNYNYTGAYDNYRRRTEHNSRILDRITYFADNYDRNESISSKKLKYTWGKYRYFKTLPS